MASSYAIERTHSTLVKAIQIRMLTGDRCCGNSRRWGIGRVQRQPQGPTERPIFAFVFRVQRRKSHSLTRLHKRDNCINFVTLLHLCTEAKISSSCLTAFC